MDKTMAMKEKYIRLLFRFQLIQGITNHTTYPISFK